MDWNVIIAIAAVLTAISTTVYVVLFAIALRIALYQLIEFEKSRKLQATLAIFRELKTRDFIDNRRYIYDFLPEKIEGVESDQLKDYFLEIEVALAAFDRVGYLLRENHIDAEPILENYWASVWRCWKKSKNIIAWVREKRGQKDYFSNFEHLFHLSEDYRIQKGYEEPKFY